MWAGFLYNKNIFGKSTSLIDLFKKDIKDRY